MRFKKVFYQELVHITSYQGSTHGTNVITALGA